jgi:hypothetical protein
MINIYLFDRSYWIRYDASPVRMSSFRIISVKQDSMIIKGEGEGVMVSQATAIMISSLLKDSSDGLDAVSVQMIT